MIYQMMVIIYCILFSKFYFIIIRRFLFCADLLLFVALCCCCTFWKKLIDPLSLNGFEVTYLLGFLIIVMLIYIIIEGEKIVPPVFIYMFRLNLLVNFIYLI